MRRIGEWDSASFGQIPSNPIAFPHLSTFHDSLHGVLQTSWRKALVWCIDSNNWRFTEKAWLSQRSLTSCLSRCSSAGDAFLGRNTQARFPLVKFSTPTLVKRHSIWVVPVIWYDLLETHKNAWFSIASVHFGAHMYFILWGRDSYDTT